MIDKSKRLEEIRRDVIEPLLGEVNNQQEPNQNQIKISEALTFLYDQVFSQHSTILSLKEDAQEIKKMFLEKKMRSIDFQTAKEMKDILNRIQDV